MLRLVFRLNRNPWHFKPQIPLLCLRTASFKVQEILHERNHESGTLLLRFSRYIALETLRSTNAVPTKIRYSDYYPITDTRAYQKQLQRTPADQFPALFFFTFTYRSNADPHKLTQALNLLDDAAVDMLPSMDQDTVYRTLYALLFLMPNWVTRMSFYRQAVKRLVNEFEKSAPKECFVQLCFYLGLEKKMTAVSNGSQLMQQLLKAHLQHYLPQLTSMDLAIVSNACFKTATPVESTAFNKALEKAVLSLPPEEINDAILVNLLKSLRFQRVRSEAVCQRLAGWCSEKPELVERMQPRGIAHVLTFFAENLWDDAECLQKLSSTFLRRFDTAKWDTPYEERIRTKDLCMYLWSAAQLNILLSTEKLEQFEKLLCNQFQDNEFDLTSDQLVDACLSMWVLGYKSQRLLSRTINMKSRTQTNARQREQPKVDSRYTVLLSAAAIESTEPEQLPFSEKPAFSLNTNAPDYLLKQRKDIVNMAKQLQEELQDLAAVNIICPINGINLPSIHVKSMAADMNDVIVELLTVEQLLKHSQLPVALVRLKLRLLNESGQKVVLVHPDDLAKNKILKDLIFDADKPEDVEKRSAQKVSP